MRRSDGHLRPIALALALAIALPANLPAWTALARTSGPDADASIGLNPKDRPAFQRVDPHSALLGCDDLARADQAEGTDEGDDVFSPSFAAALPAPGVPSGLIPTPLGMASPPMARDSLPMGVSCRLRC